MPEKHTLQSAAENFIEASRTLQQHTEDKLLCRFLYMAEIELHEVLAREAAFENAVDFFDSFNVRSTHNSS